MAVTQQSQASTAANGYGSPGQLARDLRITYLLVNDARHRLLARLFGVPQEQDAMLTAIVVLMLANAARTRARRLTRLPGLPSAGDGMLGVASVREVLGAIAGPSVRDMPGSGTLLTVAFLGAATVPLVRRSLHDVRSSSHRMSVGFHHRYGYLVDPGHWRRRRAELRESLTSAGNGRVPA